jgi:hypothetical protein
MCNVATSTVVEPVVPGNSVFGGETVASGLTGGTGSDGIQGRATL